MMSLVLNKRAQYMKFEIVSNFEISRDDSMCYLDTNSSESTAP